MGGEVPLAHVWRNEFGIQGKKLGRIWIRKGTGGKALGKEAEARNRAIVHARGIGIRKSAGLIESLGDEKRRIKTLAGVRVRAVFFSSIENAKTAANHEARGDGIGKADARCEIIEIRINQSS